MHLAELQREMTAYRDSDAVEFRARSRKDPLDSSMLIVECVASVKTPPPMESWGLIAGDILGNLRASLDHALYGHIAARHTLTEAQRQAIQFPIVIDSTKWAAKDKYYSPLVEPKVWAHIHSKQPFHDADPKSGGLHILNDLVNRDKHRTLHVFVSLATVTFDRNNAPITELPKTARPIVDGAVMGQTRMLRGVWGSGTQMVNVPGGTAYVEHIDAPGFGGRPVGALDLMENLTAATETFLDELRKLGC